MHSPHPSLPPVPVLPSERAWPLHRAAASRALEAQALADAAPHALMQRAGLAVARLAAALQPHGRRVWVAAGPGNNGGDGLVAARHLRQWGWQVQVSLLGDPAALPADARQAWHTAQAAGVALSHDLLEPPTADLCLDALLGLGASRAPTGMLAAAIAALNRQPAPVLAVDLPSGLAADTGALLGEAAVRAEHTLALLSLKPGLFTGLGRDHAGRVWLDDLGAPPAPASAWLIGPPRLARRQHAQHKGSHGDLIVLGGAAGMTGAATLAARAALAAGAGRVYLGLLAGGPDDAPPPDPARPELMQRARRAVLQPAVLARATVVCGCGGGDAVAAVLPQVLAHAGRLVLDADALNLLAAADAGAHLWPLLTARTGPTVLTPHPLEAGRLLGLSVAQVQADRLAAAQALAERSRAVVLLKGSGTVLAAPGRPPALNPSGNGRLGTPGTGDVLAGWLGGWLASPVVQAATDGGAARTADHGVDPGQCTDTAQDLAWRAAAAAAWVHGRAADQPAQGALPLRAADLVEAMVHTAGQCRP